ncbi:MAG: DEAD/DEAH box helicase family protein [Lachnospiraceae bacterium]|nr:DEAD/DEAH box helicase family protein [Lachnospiraceae bacterium]
MAEPDFAEKIISEAPVERTNVITGDRYAERFLYYQLKISIAHAEQIDIIVSFLMESGVRMILRDLEGALNRGARIRVLTGNYLGITQPAALYLLKGELGERIDLRFYNEKKRSFHPKAYIFHGKGQDEIYIGSSNLSRSALTSGIEWNYRFSSSENEAGFYKFCATFEELFYRHSIIIDDAELKRYARSWRRPAVAKDLERYEEEESDKNNDNDHDLNSDLDLDRDQNFNRDAGSVSSVFQPRGAQIEALYALKTSRAEGARKALIHVATGGGKTYLAAFDSKPYQHVLFVAHRQEILLQAAQSFRNVRQSDDYGFFNGDCKDTDKPVIFASVATLGRSQYLNKNYFAPEYFDYLVIDEFHHAANDCYKRIINYFHPQFLLGLTATPDRMDGRDIYELCDYNVPYELPLKNAVNRGVLVPFHYYGVYDETNYSGLRPVRGHYVDSELENIYLHNKARYQLIYQYYMKYHSRRALGFCCSRLHAEAMAKDFSERGIPSAAVYSNAAGAYSMDRREAVKKLRDGQLRVIFSVDMFNEGVDIPEIDMVMFLRPTESPVVFLQQLGRGLRKSRKKQYLNVLDFIGNYQKAGNTIYLLSEQGSEPDWSGNKSGKQAVSGERGNAGENKNPIDFEFPEECIVDFDMRLIQLFQEMERKGKTLKERIRSEYFAVKESLDGKVPTRMELFRGMDDGIYRMCISHAKENPFRGYLTYLKETGDLDEEEQEIYDGIGREFLFLLETTNMQKSYKMPILMAFYNNGDVKMEVSEEDVLNAWKAFFQTGTNWKDLRQNITYDEFLGITGKQHLYNAKSNPIHFLQKSGNGFFIERQGCALALRSDLKEIVRKPAFVRHMKDIIDYRTMDYYRRRYKGGDDFKEM